jgi:hypothetical protein
MSTICCKHSVGSNTIDVEFDLVFSNGTRINLWVLECRHKNFRFKTHFTKFIQSFTQWIDQETYSHSTWNPFITSDPKQEISYVEFHDTASMTWKGWQPHCRYLAIDHPFFIGIRARTEGNQRVFVLKGTALQTDLGCSIIKEFKTNLLETSKVILAFYEEFAKGIPNTIITGTIKLAPYHFRVIGDESSHTLTSRRISNYGTKGGWLASARVIFHKDYDQQDLPEPLDDYLPCELLMKNEGDLLILPYSEHITIHAICKQRDSPLIQPFEEQPTFEQVFITNAKGDFGILEHNSMAESQDNLHVLPKSEQFKCLELFRATLLKSLSK